MLVWRLPGNIVGSEPDQFSSVNISLNLSGRDRETDVTNNNLIGGPVRIEYSAISDLNITRVYVCNIVIGGV